VLPAQQLASALHELVASRQIAPDARHAVPFVQRPTASVGALSQMTSPLLPPGLNAEPQQSASVRQVSPVGRHPVGGWQTSTRKGP
jgi:hypothetical protein